MRQSEALEDGEARKDQARKDLVGESLGSMHGEIEDRSSRLNAP